MSFDLEHILSLDEWTDADRDAVRAAVGEDPQLEVALRRWFALSTAVSQRWQECAPSRNGLVLLACRDRWIESDLSEGEAALMKEVAANLNDALEAHPAIQDILDRIRSEADAFELAWNRAFESKRSDRGPVRSASARRGPLRLVRMALATAAVVATIIVGRSVLMPGADAPFATYMADASVESVTLDDGTMIRLAPGSQLDVLFDEVSQERRVLFAGSAFFDVAEGPRVFSVETPNAVTTVLGTTFGVSTKTGTDVTLVSGRVSLASLSTPENATILSPGDKGLLAEGAESVKVTSFSTLEGYDWTGLLVFRNTPMSEVAERLSEEFEVSITVSEELAESPLTGTFESDRGTKAILQIIASALGASMTENEDGSFHLSV